jgi:hypothetical protein
MEILEVRGLKGLSVRQELFEGRTGRTKCGVYLLASSFAAALLGTRRVSARRGWVGEESGFIEHPVLCTPVTPVLPTGVIQAHPQNFSVT